VKEAFFLSTFPFTTFFFIDLGMKMSTALDELKLLLLQDEWADDQKAVVDALSLLLGVAAMKTHNTSRMELFDNENHIASITDVIFNEFSNNSSDRIVFSDSSEDESSEEDESDKKTETYFTADEYDVSKKYFPIALYF
jgi:hypothetical protein